MTDDVERLAREIIMLVDHVNKLVADNKRLVDENATLRLGWSEFKTVGVRQEERIARLVAIAAELVRVFGEPVCPDQHDAVNAYRKEVDDD